ncbi:uncharacterized protein LOC132039350 [Lycium ferocissimum]|uniref:uncharacterized protein LOC132039350 n=1 Tax=Lycium ferocissimum TaxID=112874 RepID=UPI002814E385|nr:uncharacterized protein LOC132039350 [Lycium ferocissimum]
MVFFGTDGFSGKFYHYCGDIIEKDVVEFVQPISLSNFTSKIITKLISRRLNPILPLMISENQSGFLKGRIITENIQLAQEIVQNVKNKNKGGNVVIKLDMAKAYNIMSWPCIYAALRKFDFSEEVTNLIMGIVSNVWYPIINNGTRNDTGAVINHLSYADNIVIFSSENSKSFKMIMKQIHWYNKSSGKKMNKDKCFFLTASGTTPSRINNIKEATSFLDKQFPFEYLGCPVYIGRKRVEYFEKMLSKVIKRLSGWQSNMLSHGERLSLFKSVLQSLPIYTLTALSPPKGTILLMEKHFAKFFWGSSNDKRNYHWSS